MEKIAQFYANRLIAVAAANPPLEKAMLSVNDAFHGFMGVTAGDVPTRQLALLDAFRSHQRDYPLTHAIIDKLAGL